VDLIGSAQAAAQRTFHESGPLARSVLARDVDAAEGSADDRVVTGSASGTETGVGEGRPGVVIPCAEERILELNDGSRVLRVEGLDTSDGPDLKVWLSDQPVIDGVDCWGVFDDGAYVSLGDLKGNRGNQNYLIPADVDLADYTAVSIWCERFAVSFGAAEFTA
jgi:hypothetical protein